MFTMRYGSCVFRLLVLVICVFCLNNAGGEPLVKFGEDIALALTQPSELTLNGTLHVQSLTVDNVDVVKALSILNTVTANVLVPLQTENSNEGYIYLADGFIETFGMQKSLQLHGTTLGKVLVDREEGNFIGRMRDSNDDQGPWKCFDGLTDVLHWQGCGDALHNNIYTDIGKVWSCGRRITNCTVYGPNNYGIHWSSKFVATLQGSQDFGGTWVDIASNFEPSEVANTKFHLTPTSTEYYNAHRITFRNTELGPQWWNVAEIEFFETIEAIYDYTSDVMMAPVVGDLNVTTGTITVLFEEIINCVVNTDFVISVSRDNGSTYVPVTLTAVLSLPIGVVYTGAVSFQGTPTGKDMQFAIHANACDARVDGVAFQFGLA